MPRYMLEAFGKYVVIKVYEDENNEGKNEK